MLHPKQQHIVDIYGKLPTTLNEIAESCIAVISAQDPVIGFAWDIRYDNAVSCSHNAPIGERTDFTSKKDRPTGFPGFVGRMWIRYADAANTDNWNSNFNASLTYTGTGGSGAYNGLWENISSASYRTRVPRPGNDSWHRRYDYKYPAPNCFSTDYKFFLGDFPALENDYVLEYQAHEEEQDRLHTFGTLQGRFYNRKRFILTHQFNWEDPATKAADDAFLAEYYGSLKSNIE